MKRTFAVVTLLAALGVLCKLAWRDAATRPNTPPTAAIAPGQAALQVAPEEELRRRYPDDAALIDRVLEQYHHNALSIERTDGRRGLVLLDRLGMEAIYLYEKYPREFRELAGTLDDDAAADLLLHWREYFGLKRADETDRRILIAEIASLNASQRRAAARYPNALPLILAEPVGVTDLIERWRGDREDLRDALVLLDFISLEQGAADLRAALRTLDNHPLFTLEAFRLQGPEGLALVRLYGPVLEALGDDLPLDDALILLRVNTDDVDHLLTTHTPETVASYLRHVAAAGLTEAVGGSPHALRLTVEYGDRGDQALRQAGPDAADVVYEEYADPTLRSQAVESLAEHGTMALAMLAKYADDSDFREILRRYGPRVIPPIAQTDSSPEALAALRSKREKSFTESAAQGILALSQDSGQATIQMIREDGLERVESLYNADGVRFYQFLPLYDVVHLGQVMGHGHAPTTGEMTWALIDGCFVVADVLSLATVQPEGVAATEAARSELKAVTRHAAETASRELVEEATEIGGRALAREGSEAAAEQLSRWWAVRMAGGTYQVLRRLPEAIGQLSAAEIARIGRPLAEKAGLRLSTWSPIRLLKDGRLVTFGLPPQRGLKYVGVQALQAGVGVVGFRKMEEHLASRRPEPPSTVQE